MRPGVSALHPSRGRTPENGASARTRPRCGAAINHADVPFLTEVLV